MPIRHAVAAFAAASAFVAASMAVAQTPADFGKFNASCLAATPMLLGQVPEGFDATPILTPLCGCLATSLKDLPQKDVDMLEADLAGTATDETHTAHGAYDALAQTAGTALSACFEDPEVTAAIQKAAPPVPDSPPPGAPATETPATPPVTPPAEPPAAPQ